MEAAKKRERSDPHTRDSNTHESAYNRNHLRGSYHDHLTPYEKERLQTHREDCIVIDGFETENYTAPWAWAHTIPERSVMCRLPPERTDYRLPIEVHEILHNLYPDAPEEAVREMAFDKSRAHEARSRAFIRYR